MFEEESEKGKEMKAALLLETICN